MTADLSPAFSPRPVSSSMMQLAVAAEFSVSPGRKGPAADIANENDQ